MSHISQKTGSKIAHLPRAEMSLQDLEWCPKYYLTFKILVYALSIVKTDHRWVVKNLMIVLYQIRAVNQTETENSNFNLRSRRFTDTASQPGRSPTRVVRWAESFDDLKRVINEMDNFIATRIWASIGHLLYHHETTSCNSTFQVPVGSKRAFVECLLCVYYLQ